MLTLSFASATAVAQDFEQQKLNNWHQWRGPLANGTSPGANPPVEWSPTKNVRWKVEIPGQASASPIVWNNRVFVLTAVPTDRKAPASREARSATPSSPPRRGGGGAPNRGAAPSNYYQFMVLCLDRNTGQELWRKVAAEQVPHEPGHQTNTFASGSPMTDGRFLYVSFGSVGIFCYDLQGNLQWKTDLGDMQTRNGFGEGASPALHQDTLVVPWDHEAQSFIAALDARTGDIRWKVNRDEVTTWATPLIVEHQGRMQVIANGSNRVRSYDLKDGRLLWECGGQASNPIPSPVVQGDLVYCMTGYRGYAVYAIPLDSMGDITDSDQIAWSRTDTGPYVSSPVLYGGQLYFTKGRDAILSSLDIKTGEPLIEQVRLPGLNTMYASPVAAAGRVYFTSREGATIVLKHGPKFEVLATNRMDEGIDASPALVGNQMFLRRERHLYCIENTARDAE
jgi:outer membrane protein assembly factor BamB